jgi:hypothetical protein
VNDKDSKIEQAVTALLEASEAWDGANLKTLSDFILEVAATRKVKAEFSKNR